MLKSFRDFSNTWVAKVLLFLIIISFGAIFNVSDVFRGRSNSTALSTIGSEEVTYFDFLRRLELVLMNVKSITKQNVTKRDLFANGIAFQVIHEMEMDAALQAEAKRLGIRVSDAEIAKMVLERLPFLKTENGQFDKKRFQAFLAMQKMTEDDFFRQNRRSLMVEQLKGGINVPMQAPNLLVDIIYKRIHEERSGLLAEIRYRDQKIKPATAEELKTFYQSHSKHFMAPEYRDFTVLKFSADDFTNSNKLNLSESALKAEFTKHREQYATPEKRKIKQLVFNSEQKAKSAEAAAKQGRSLDWIAKDFKKKDPKAFWLEKKRAASFAAIVFKTRVGKVSELVKDAHGNWFLFQVLEEQKRVEPTYASVKEKVRKNLRLRYATDLVNETSKEIEDALASGSTLKEAARKKNLTARSFTRVDFQGRDKDENQVKSLSAAELQAAFAENDIDAAGDAKQGPNNSIFFIQVHKITPPTLKSLKEVKNKVSGMWVAQKQREKAHKLAEEISKKIKDGTTLSVAAKYNNLSTKTLSNLSRHKLMQDEKSKAPSRTLSRQVNALFSINKKGQAVSYEGNEGITFVSYEKSTQPKSGNAAKNEKSSIKRGLENSFIRETTQQYLGSIFKEFTIKRNEGLLEAMIKQEN